MVKNPLANAGATRDTGLIPGLGRSPGEGNGNPSPVFLPGKSHEKRNLVDCRPWCGVAKELDTTKQTYTTDFKAPRINM